MFDNSKVCNTPVSEATDQLEVVFEEWSVVTSPKSYSYRKVSELAEVNDGRDGDAGELTKKWLYASNP